MVGQVDVERVLTGLKRAAATALNEEEFKVSAERVLYDEVISKLGLQPGRYEYTFISGGRLDALYGHVLIEYKAPGKLSKPSDIAGAKKQLIGCIRKEAEVEERYKLFLGVILSDRIAFVRYDPKVRDWVMRGPYDLNRETVLRLIEAMRGLRRKRLAVDELLRDFGPKSPITRKAVKVFYDKVTESKSSKVEALFNDWKRLFSQVCAYSPEKLKGLEVEYGVGGKVNYDALLFSIHTYYALLMKLLGAEVAYLYGAGKWLKSYVAELEDAHMRGLDVLKRTLEDLEGGGVFRSLLNITNFIEGDYFSWYLEELDEELAEVIAEIAKRLSDYEPATPVLEPEQTRDMLKRLYQNLVPKKIRHDLGEYYTPDWLAELLLNEVGLTVENFEKLSQEKNDPLAPLNLRVLDPACGSGTFLILLMKRLREYAEEHYLRDMLASYLLRNVVGFDLNPLAVLTARTNYLLAVADLLPYVKGPIEIPIYLADSLLVGTRTTLTGTTYVIRTYVGEFQMPKSIVEKGLLGRLLEVIDRYVRLRYRVEDFRQVVKNELNLDKGELQLIGDLYRTFLKLEEEGKNHVWTSIIKNAFAPLIITSSIGKFDYVVGNPPWIAWENLPKDYRESVRPLFERYRLIPSKLQAKLKLDLSMLFSYVGMDRYLREGGLFGFLITQTVFVSIAGEGFRKFVMPDRTPLRVVRVHDLVELLPFEGAQNRTAMFVAKKGEKTIFPVPYIKWRPRQGLRVIEQSWPLEEVLLHTDRFELYTEPILSSSSSPWLALKKGMVKKLRSAIGKSVYKAFEGAGFTPRAVFIVKVLGKVGNHIIIKNEKWPRAKIKLDKEVVERVKADVVYPVIFGRDVHKWKIDRHKMFYSIVLYEPRTGMIMRENLVKIKYPHAYSYFANFKKELMNAANYKQFGKGKPFFFIFRLGKQMFAPFKVVWREVGTKVDAVVIGSLKDQRLGEKSTLLDYTCVYIPLDNEEEAHYICAVLNSAISRIVTSYIHLHPDPHVLDYIRIPRYNQKNNKHRQLVNLSKKAHKLAAKNGDSELIKVEEDIDRLVAQLYGLTDDDLKEIKRSLAILEGREVEQEEVEEEPKEVKVDFLDAVVRPNTVGSFEVAVSNPVEDKVTIELQLPGRPVRLETDKGEERIRVKVPPLEVGEYKVPYKIITSDRVVEGIFTLYVKEEERHRAREVLASKLDELLGG